LKIKWNTIDGILNYTAHTGKVHRKK